ncbi:thioredoxin family protein [Polaribacter dokdonensis]|uniref:Redoxin n=1 Tax=Polaribacter dokdonensis DSW-5 TaxID=1300348 RepID=A0A0N0UNR3_9FLAO|nr:thioredoxin family protein [Polaribacter dokdonensis]KOY52310.1 Redoxin [Polaribacter dokdonensis DSW-5]SEE43103.1 Peroxiredoxin [Polaribacter dokdonensis DSW-5]
MKTIKTIFALMAITIFASAFTSKSTATYKVGDSIEDFSLMNIDDKMVSLADYTSAKGFIIIFTCNTCPYSVANEDRIIALNNKYASKGFPVIAINPNDPDVVPDDSFAAMKVRASKKGFNFPYLLDKGQKVYPKFGATKTPHVYIVSKPEMKVEYIGAIDDSSRNPDAVNEKYVENAVDALLVGKKIDKTTTKAIGCSIKTK